MVLIRYPLKFFLRSLCLLFLLPFTSVAQPATEKQVLLNRFSYSDLIPQGLLASRSVLLYDEVLTYQQLEEIQKAFQATGIDALAYFQTDQILAGADPQKAFGDYLTGRNIQFIILVEQSISNYTITIFRFNGKPSLVDVNAAAWRQTGSVLKDVLLTIFRLALSNQPKQNLLINDYPETDIPIRYFSGRRDENYTGQVKSMQVAVPRFGEAAADEKLDQLVKENFPVKYELVDPELTEAELMRRGFGLVLRCVHTQGRLAKQILNYDVSQLGTSIPSVAIINNEMQLKNIPSGETVYKFYIKHLEYGNIYLGNKWDADQAWTQALINHLTLMRQDLKY